MSKTKQKKEAKQSGGAAAQNGHSTQEAAKHDGDISAGLKLLVAPQKLKVFTDKTWSKEPAVLQPAPPQRKTLFRGLLSTYDQVVNLAEQEKLVMGHDIDIDIPDAEHGQEAEAEQIRDAWQDERAPIVVNQPQRFHDGYWQLIASLEAELGCLVGCKVVLVREGSEEGAGVLHEGTEGETFLCQLNGEGTVQWLFNQSDSVDSEEENIAPGEATLKAGDVLYLPRGCEYGYEPSLTHDSALAIIQCDAAYSWNTIVTQMLQGEGLPEPLEASLPPGTFAHVGIVNATAAAAKGGSDAKAGSSTPSQQVAKTLAASLKALAARIESEPDVYLSPALDVMETEFMKKRLPPHPEQLKDKGPEPELGDSVLVRGSGLFTIKPLAHEDSDSESESDEGESEESDEDEDTEEDNGSIMVCHPFTNERHTHMAHLSHCHHSHDQDHDEADLERLMGAMGSDSESEGEEKEGEGVKKEEGLKQEDKANGHAANGVKKSEKGESEDASGSEESDDSDDSMSDMSDEEYNGLRGMVVPAAFALVVSKVLSATSEPGVAIRDLVELMPNKDAEETVQFVRHLWDSGYLTCVRGGSKAEGKANRAREGGEGDAAGDAPASKKARKDDKSAGAVKKARK